MGLSSINGSRPKGNFLTLLVQMQASSVATAATTASSLCRLIKHTDTMYADNKTRVLYSNPQKSIQPHCLALICNETGAMHHRDLCSTIGGATASSFGAALISATAMSTRGPT